MKKRNMTILKKLMVAVKQGNRNNCSQPRIDGGRWPIQTEAFLKAHKEKVMYGPGPDKEAFENTYLQSEHNFNYLRLSRDPAIQELLIELIPDTVETIFLPGCGPDISLQKAILDRCANVKRIVGCDLSNTAIAKARNAAQKMGIEKKTDFVLCDMANLQIKCDCIIIINSIIGGDDLHNRDCLTNLYRNLSDGGCLIGFFPTINSIHEALMLETQHLEKVLSPETIDVVNNLFFDVLLGVPQIYYGISRLRRILVESGFEEPIIMNYFLNSSFMAREFSRLYGMADPDLMYEHFVIASK